MKTLNKINLETNFNETFLYKDCSLKFIERKFPDLAKEIENIASLLPSRKFVTVDIGFLIMKEGDKTCVDTGWHVDGVENDYIILCKGDFRTEFLGTKIETKFPDVTSDLRAFNNSIACQLSDVAGEEIPDSTLIQYTSHDIHRGRVATSAGERFFLRVCSSDYLVPKNAKLR